MSVKTFELDFREVYNIEFALEDRIKHIEKAIKFCEENNLSCSSDKRNLELCKRLLSRLED